MIPVLTPTEIQNLLIENSQLRTANKTLEAQLEQAHKLTVIALVEYFKVRREISINLIQAFGNKVWTIHSNDLVIQVTQEDLDKIEFLFPEGEPMIALGQNSVGDLLLRLVPEPKGG